MRILSISLKNIKSHRDRELHFVSGINVLSGPNGAGKSTVFEAIGYALFGVDARDFVGNIDRFLTIGEKKGEIGVIFETDDGKIFRASRTVGAGSRWLLARKTGDAFEIEDHSGAPETEARIKELLGLVSGRSLADQFKLVIGPFQHDFLGPFVLRQPTKRQEAFDEILGIDAWRKTYKGTATLQAAVRSRIEVLAAEIAGKEEQLAVLPERVKELAGVAGEAEARQKQMTEKQAALIDTSGRLAALDEQEKAITELATALQVLENRIHDGKEKIADQNRHIAEAEQAVETLEKNRPGKELFEQAEKKLKVLREKDKQRLAIEKDANTLDNEYNRLRQTLEHERREIEQTGKQLTEEKKLLQKEMQSLGADEKTSAMAARLPGLREEAEKARSSLGLLEGRRAGLLEGKEKLSEGTCPFFRESCLNIAGRTPRDVFTAGIEEMDREILVLEERVRSINRDIEDADTARQQMDFLRIRGQELEKQLKGIDGRRADNSKRSERLEEIRSNLSTIQEKATARKRELKEFSGLEAEIAQAEKQRAANQQGRDAFHANLKVAEDVGNRREALKKMTSLFNELQQELKGKQKELQKLRKHYDREMHAEVRKAREQLVADVASLQQQMENLARDRARLEEEIRKLKVLREEIKEKQEKKKSYATREELVKFLRGKVFNNVSAQLSERFREEISLRADRIYRTISEADEELFWGERYQVILRDMPDGGLRVRSDDQLSGGQIMSAVVALRLALLQTIGARIAFFDEPTSNLDAARRENLAHAFRAIDIGREEVTEHWYDQLFLISHDVAFTEVTDQVIQLEQSGT